MSSLPTSLSGGCHCGNIRVRFESSHNPTELSLRVCGCSFCRAHSGRTTVDPQGQLALRFVERNEVSHYRFGHKTADFLICRRCGVYIASIMPSHKGLVGALNVNVLDVREVFRQPALAVDYEDEQAAERIARRAATWIPTSIVQ